MGKQNLTVTWVALFVLSCMFWAAPLPAQVGNGQISGYARDPQGLPVPRVKVAVRSTLIGLYRTTVTNQAGYYVETALPPGTYTVTGEAAGFRAYTYAGINLTAGAAVSADIKLQVGAPTQHVTVTAATQMVSTDTSQVGGVITGEELTQLPNESNDFLNLVGLLPGVISSDDLNRFTGQPYSNPYTVNGGQGYATNWQIDGVSNNRTRDNGNMTAEMAPQSVQEVQIVSTTFNAEYGRDSTGQINFITKSGTQDYHGSVYYYGENTALESRDIFQSSVAPLHWNAFGFNFGGPIYIPGVWNTNKSKLFFFFGMEWNPDSGVTTDVGYEPPEALRMGDLNDSPPGQPKAINPATKQQFPGNQIPQSMLSPNGFALSKVFPLPTTSALSGNNWIENFPGVSDFAPLTLRVDYSLSARNRITFRGDYTWAWYNNVQPFSIAGTQVSQIPHKGVMVGLTSTITPTWLNQASFGASEDTNIFNTVGAGFDRASYGIDYPYVFPASNKLDGTKIPNVTTTIASFSGGAYPSHSTGPIAEWRDDLTHMLGSHQIKMGVYYERAEENDDDQLWLGGYNENGAFTFQASPSNPLTTGYSWADMLLGHFDSYSEVAYRNMTPWRGHMIAGYIQDSWKTRRNLTLEYGFRLSYMPPFFSKWNNIETFDPSLYNPSDAVTVTAAGGVVPGSGNVYDGIALAGSGWPSSAIGTVREASVAGSAALFHGLPRSMTTTRPIPEPRLGFAWDVGGHHTTVVRGGAGIFADRIVVDDWNFPGGVSPLQPIVNIENGSVDDPTGGGPVSFPLVGTMTDYTSHNPISYQWSLGIQHQFSSNLMWDVTYIGTSGNYESGSQNWNQPAFGADLSHPGVALDALRPYPGMSYIRFVQYAYNSNYNALQTSVTKRFHNGLMFGANYTWAHAIDEAEGYGDTALNEYDPFQGRYASAGFDVPQSFKAYYIYDLPFLLHRHGFLRQLGGWEVSGITLFQAGEPTGMGGVSGDPSGTGNGARPDWVSNPNAAPSSGRTVAHWFNTASVVQPPNYSWGDLGRNVLWQPGLNDWDLSAFKNFQLGERVHLQFRCDFFNAFNHTQLKNLQTSITAGNFGAVTGVEAGRNIQLGANLTF